MRHGLQFDTLQSIAASLPVSGASLFTLGVDMRLKPVIVVPIGLSMTAIAVAFLYLHVERIVRNRMEYQSWVPWFIGLVLALVVGLWPVSCLRSFRARLIVRSLVFTLCLAPIPYGPEGTLVPAFLAMIFPPLVMLFLAPIGPLLTFVAVLGVVASHESIVSVGRRIAQDASHEPPPAAAFQKSEQSMKTQLETKAPADGGGR